MQIDLRTVSKSFGSRKVVDAVSLQIPAGGFFALLGPSGSGKSTLLGLIAGLIAPDAGEIRLGDRLVSDPKVRVPGRDRGVGMVFQDLALWPHMTAKEHLRFVAPAADAAALLRRVELSERADARPATLSGGEAQRLAIARALAGSPKILLLDEPVGTLDRRLRESLLDVVKKVHRESGATTVYVTHDYEEAFRLADRVGVLIDGKLMYVGSPQDSYDRPPALEIARLTGPVSEWKDASGSVCWARPEKIHLRPDENGSAEVRGSRYLGGVWEMEVIHLGQTIRAQGPTPVSGRVSLDIKGT